MKKPPCKDCPRRFPGCHSICPTYCGWKTSHETARAEERAAKEAEGSVIGAVVETHRRIQRAKKRHG